MRKSKSMEKILFILTLLLMGTNSSLASSDTGAAAAADFGLSMREEAPDKFTLSRSLSFRTWRTSVSDPTNSILWGRMMREGRLHEGGYLWPLKYLEIFFVEGLLNDCIGLSLSGAKIERAEKGIEFFYASPLDMGLGIFLRNIFKGLSFKIAPPKFLKIGENLNTMNKILNEAANGLRQNTFLRSIGGSYQKMKFRTEKNGNAKENDRADLLQDCVLNIVQRFYTEYLSAQLNLFLRKKTPTNVEEVAKILAEDGPAYAYELARNYHPEIFEGEIRTEDRVNEDRLGVLLMENLGPDREDVVPEFLKKLASSEEARGIRVDGSV